MTGHLQRNRANGPIQTTLCAAHCLTFCWLSVSLWTAPRPRHTLPEWTFMCSPTHSVNEKKLHFPIVRERDDGSARGHKEDVWRRTISSEKSPRTCRQSASRWNYIFNPTLRLLTSVGFVCEALATFQGSWSWLFVCHMHWVSHFPESSMLLY